MALLKFLKLDPAKKELPHPSEPLSIVILTSSIAALALHAFIVYWMRLLPYWYFAASFKVEVAGNLKTPAEGQQNTILLL